jgi:GT2 family glycosyltransferase
MQLSVVIVNYNSRLLLEKCLQSVEKATKNISHEIVVIDNSSTDGSCDYLSYLFPEVKIIFNDKNLGFAKACNQGLKISTGDNVLFLNPDTILEENTLSDCLSFLEQNTDAGAVGVRMKDAAGTFLKESKRGKPSPAASFFKLFGFAAIFPRSKTFAKYYMGHLPEKEINRVDVLSGAFMMIKKIVLDKTGGFDESFFMYGEDIDLSIRIKNAGFENYYLGTTNITHKKGGSTHYDYNHLQHFYGAMKLFVKKYYKGEQHEFTRWLLLTGIQLRKLIAIISLPFR